ncbi:MAG: hypothetical protein ABL888_13140 [Pirellulaceae bacterium]
MAPNIKAPIIKVTVKQEPVFKFLWLKYVRGFNPTHHCARCLAGSYSTLFPFSRGYVPAQTIEGVLDESDAPWIYLCGVTNKWIWNVHVAGQFEAGAITNYSDERIDVEIRDFRRLPIDASKAPEAAKEFATCRNWQFGWMAFDETQPTRRLFE